MEPDGNTGPRGIVIRPLRSRSRSVIPETELERTIVADPRRRARSELGVIARHETEAEARRRSQVAQGLGCAANECGTNRKKYWSGRRASNPLPQPWQVLALVSATLSADLELRNSDTGALKLFST